MGAILPRPVTTKVLERQTIPGFHVGLAFMNGFREKMEDAHTVFQKDDWAFFGVFDGHCGPLCSKFMAEKFPEALKELTAPIPDATVTEISLRLDKEFIDRNQEGGSTGTFVVVRMKDGKYEMQVGNVGDSRVVLARRDHFDDGVDDCRVSLTVDHKPCLDEERMRIEAAGGHVSNNRVDGSLAVSRAFGDASYKNKGPQESKVIAVPDFKHFTASPGDVVLLCCDGVFENDAFTDETVIEFIVEHLKQNQDLATVAAAVVDEAMARGSKDNISAMLVQLGGDPDCPNSDSLPRKEVIAGAYSAPNNQKFCNAYTYMATEAGLSDAECLELRYDQTVANLQKRREVTVTEDKTCDLKSLSLTDLRRLCERHGIELAESTTAKGEIIELLQAKRNEDAALDLRPVDVQEMEKELEGLAVPDDVAAMERGSQARLKWFSEWMESEKGKAEASQGEGALLSKALELQSKIGLPLNLILNLLQTQSDN